jgi:serine/threonine protein kinase
MNTPLLPALPGYSDPELIAHGTTALVFRATQTALNRPVAIKVITADTNAGSVPVNVERELATTVALSSQPHIVSIIDTGVTPDDRRYIVMEYCEGGSYAQILRQQGPLPVEDVIEVGIKIGQALHAAHQVGIVHRDVKPSNILRSRFGPALTDFGIARAPDELASTLTREMMTPHHASPEALLHQAQSGLSDVYSLASTMWTLLVGHPPFVDPEHPDMDMYQFRDRVLHEPLPPMPREDVPEWLVAELRRAMAKLPAQRHGSALEFSEALQRGVLGIESARAATALTSTTFTSTTPSTATAAPVAIVRPRATDDQPVRHTPGLPAEAWPVPDPPPASTPATAPAGADTPGAAAPAPADPRRPVLGQPAASTTAAAIAPSTAGPSTAPAPPAAPIAPPAPLTPIGTPPIAAPPTPSVPAAPATSAPPAPAVPPAPAAPQWAPPAPAVPSAPASPSGVAAPPVSAPPPPSGPAPSAAAQAVSAPAGPVPAGPAAAVPGPPGGAGGPIYRRPEPAAPPAPATHPLGGPPPPLAEVEQEGWLPQPDESAGPGWAAPIPTRGEPRPHREGVTAPSGGRRGGLLAVLVGVVVLTVTIGALLFLSHGGQPEDPSASGANEPSPSITVEPTLITAGPEGAPTDVRIDEDLGTSVTLTWTAPAGGPQSYVAVAYRAGSNDPLDVRTVPGGQSEMSVTFTDLDEDENYCFAIGVLYSVSEVAPATVCTTR